jgi:hypothetical protein
MPPMRPRFRHCCARLHWKRAKADLVRIYRAPLERRLLRPGSARVARGATHWGRRLACSGERSTNWRGAAGIHNNPARRWSVASLARSRGVAFIVCGAVCRIMWRGTDALRGALARLTRGASAARHARDRGGQCRLRVGGGVLTRLHSVHARQSDGLSQPGVARPLVEERPRLRARERRCDWLARSVPGMQRLRGSPGLPEPSPNGRRCCRWPGCRRTSPAG